MEEDLDGARWVRRREESPYGSGDVQVLADPGVASIR